MMSEATALAFRLCHIRVTVEPGRRIKLDGGGSMSSREALALACKIFGSVIAAHVKKDRARG